MRNKRTSGLNAKAAAEISPASLLCLMSCLTSFIDLQDLFAVSQFFVTSNAGQFPRHFVAVFLHENLTLIRFRLKSSHDATYDQYSQSGQRLSMSCTMMNANLACAVALSQHTFLLNWIWQFTSEARDSVVRRLSSFPLSAIAIVGE